MKNRQFEKTFYRRLKCSKALNRRERSTFYSDITKQIADMLL
jgi:hypothetical protein